MRVNNVDYRNNQLSLIDGVYRLNVEEPITQIRFYQDSNISEVVKLNVSKVTNMNDMFYKCASLREIDANNWVTPSVTAAYAMFGFCPNLEIADISNWDTSGMKSTDAFYGSNNLHTLRMDNCSRATISMITGTGDFPSGTIEGVTRTIYCKESNAAGLTAPKGWVFSYVPEGPALYVPGEFNESSVTEVVTMVNESHTDLSNMFNSCFNLTSVNTKDWDTSNVENMSGMFSNCSSLQSLDLSSFDTSNVTKMNDMFFYCNNLEELDLRNFYMGVVDEYAGIGSMFGYCENLKRLRLDNCNDVTISLIIRSSNFPTNAINGVSRTIYCKQSESYDRGLLPPENWIFRCVDTGNIIDWVGGMI
jgi:surface protein